MHGYERLTCILNNIFIADNSIWEFYECLIQFSASLHILGKKINIVAGFFILMLYLLKNELKFGILKQN